MSKKTALKIESTAKIKNQKYLNRSKSSMDLTISKIDMFTASR